MAQLTRLKYQSAQEFILRLEPMRHWSQDETESKLLEDRKLQLCTDQE